MTKRTIETETVCISIDYTALKARVYEDLAWRFVDELDDGETIDWSDEKANYFVECRTNMYKWTEEEVGSVARSASFYLTVEGINSTIVFEVEVYDLHGKPEVDMGLYEVTDVSFYL